VGAAIGQGKAQVIRNVSQINQFRPGEVLITNRTDPDWEPIMKQASAIVTNQGGRTCFTGETKILTNQGFMSLSQIHEQGYQGLSTLSLNTKTQKINNNPTSGIIDKTLNEPTRIPLNILQSMGMKKEGNPIEKLPFKKIPIPMPNKRTTA
jgi:pyruvate,water dikinase